jgi:hypothetical protein
MLNLTASALLIFASAAHASPVEFVIGTSSTVDVTYFGLGSSYSYSVTGSISAEVTDTSVIIIGGTLDLVGSGPDSSMTITGGELSHDGAGFFWDFGQGPFDAGVPTENPGYILDSTGFTGTLGDMFGNFSLGGFFGGEGFGLADDGSTHSMSSFFWNGDAVVVPVPTAVWLFGSALAGLGLLRRRR